MKKLISIFLALSLLTGTYSCQERNKVELISANNNNNYLFLKNDLRNNKNKMGVFSFNADQIKKFNNAIEKIKTKIKNVNKNFPIYFSYKLYINEKGKIDKIVALSSLSSKIDKLLTDEMQNWQMNIFSRDYPQKYAIDWNFSLFKTKGKSEISLLNSTLPVNEKISNEKADDYYVQVEEMPSPIGGVQGIQEKIHYPETAKRAGIEGRVYIKAYIDEKGNVAEAEVIKGLDGGCNEEALKAVKSTKFTPGRNSGRAVKTQVSIPILFKLDSKK